MKKLLLVFPHPDDESFTCGGTIAKYVAAGWDVHLVCATRGEVGERGALGETSDEDFGQVRQKELEAAGTILGLSTITFLGFKDGTLSKLSPGELEDRVFREMVRLVPHVVITYEPRGITNHPDHMKLTIATTVAFQRFVLDVADLPQFADLAGARQRRLGHTYKASFEECLALEHAPRLYYACLPETVVGYLKKLKIISNESFGKPLEGTPDKFITTVIDVKRFQSKKVKALQAHQSQTADAQRLLSLAKNPLFMNEYFILRMSGYDEVFMGKNDTVSNRL
ncbi:PIG-L family deacetylase [Candidatus Gottesmanbacteria bacterium]|nr:PIG-L family deacetylase [Candidatus Gottesmanbacteria bacterium]